MSNVEWRDSVIFFRGTCAYCGRTMRRGEFLVPSRLTIVPGYIPGNTVPACTHCVTSKSNADWREWLMKQPFFNQERMNEIFRWRYIMQNIEGGTKHED